MSGNPLFGAFWPWIADRADSGRWAAAMSIRALRREARHEPWQIHAMIG